MKMKHYLPMAVLALSLAACSDDYDDTALWEQVNDNTSRIEALEQWQDEVNNNIAALQQLLNTTDYITSVTPRNEERQGGGLHHFVPQLRPDYDLPRREGRQRR